jgi:hypothetical protein
VRRISVNYKNRVSTTSVPCKRTYLERKERETDQYLVECIIEGYVAMQEISWEPFNSDLGLDRDTRLDYQAKRILIARGLRLLDAGFKNYELRDWIYNNADPDLSLRIQLFLEKHNLSQIIVRNSK